MLPAMVDDTDKALLFEAAGARFGFDEPLIAPLMSAIGDELSRLAP